MICQDYLILFCDFIDKRLSEEQEKAMQEHCTKCNECSMAWKELVENSEKIRNLRRFSVSPSFVLDVMSHLEKKQSTPIIKIPMYPFYALAACVLLSITIGTFLSYKESNSIPTEPKVTLALEEKKDLAREKEQEQKKTDFSLAMEEEKKIEAEEEIEVMNEMDEIPTQELAEAFSQKEERKSSPGNMAQCPAPSSIEKEMPKKSIMEKKELRRSNVSKMIPQKKELLSSIQKTVSPFASQFFLESLGQENLKKSSCIPSSPDKKKAKGMALDKPKIEIAMISHNPSHDHKLLSEWFKVLPDAVSWEWQEKERKVWLFQGDFPLSEAKEILLKIENTFSCASSSKEKNQSFSEEADKTIFLVLWMLE